MQSSQHSSIGPQPDASSLGSSERRFSSLANDLAFVLGDGRHNMQHEAASMRHVHGDKIHVPIHETRYKRHGARQSVQLGDQQRRSGSLANREGFEQLRPIVLAAALDLHELHDDGGQTGDEELADSIALGFEPKPRSALLVRAHSIIGHEPLFSHAATVFLEQVEEGLPVPGLLRPCLPL